MPFSATRDLWLVLKARDEASRALRSFSRDVRMVGDSVEQANLQASRSRLLDLRTMQRMTGATQKQQVATQKAIESTNKQIHQSRIARAAAEEHRVSMQRLSSNLTGVAAAAGTVGVALTAAGVMGLRGMQGLIDANIEYSKQASLTRTQVDGFVNSQKEIEDAGLRIARTIPTVFEEIQPALFDIFSSLEINLNDATVLLETFAKAGVAGQTEIQKAGRSTIGILNAFQLPLSDVNHLMDLQFQLVQEGLGTYEEWAGRIGLVTPSAVRFGQSVEMMTAALAAATRMGIPAARAATAVSRAMDAMSNPKAVTELLDLLNVQSLNPDGTFRPMIDIMKEFRTELAKLPKAERIGTLLDVFKGAGGTIEARRFLQNMLLTPGNLELFETIFQEMSTQSGSFAEAYAIMADSTFGKTQMLKNQWETLKVMAGQALAPAFLVVVKALSGLVEWFNKLSPRTKQFIVIGAAITLVLGTLAGILALIVGGIAAMAAAFVVAGTAVLTTVAAVSLFLVGLAGLIAILTVLITKSEIFRGIISTIGEGLTTLWKEHIVPTGKAIRDAWEKHMQPPLQKLRDIIINKVVPAVKDLTKALGTPIFAAILGIAAGIKDVLTVAFAVLAEIIEKVVIPVVERITKFYNENKETIDRLIKSMALVAKWALRIAVILGAILTVVLTGPLLGAIIAVTTAIMVMVATAVKIYTTAQAIVDWFKIKIPKALQAMGDFFVRIWGHISDFFIGVWSGLVTFLQGVWETITGIFNDAMSAIGIIWNYFWTTKIGGLVRAVFGLIIAIINLAMAVARDTILRALVALKSIWDRVLNAFYTTIIIIWREIQTALGIAWATIKKAFLNTWNAIADAFAAIWNRISGKVNEKATQVKTLLAAVWNMIVGTVKTKWNQFYDNIRQAVEKAKDKITSVFDIVKNFFKNAGSWLFDAGRKIIGGLIDGITSMINKLTDKINEIAKKIRDRFPLSPAKAGPLAGRGSPFMAGQKIASMIADGMDRGTQAVIAASNRLAGSVSPGNASLVSNGTMGNRGFGGTNQNITINTQELNPRRQAAEIGWLLSGRS